jgi:putative hydrolase of the HAD superfamily
MIKAIFFDFDGVLTLTSSATQQICEYICKRTNLKLEKVISCYRKRVYDLYKGKATHKDVWEDFCKCVGKEIDIKILEKCFLETPINEKMFDLAKKLRVKYKVGIITDNSNDKFKLLSEHLRLKDLFDSLILSADLGVMKDDKLIFNKAIESMNVKAEECVFIDNKHKNLQVPNQIGMKTIFYDHDKNDILQLISELKNLGLAI